jgi:hypothetical protein
MGDVLFQNVRSRVVIVCTHAFIFLICVSLVGSPINANSIALVALLLLFAPTLCGVAYNAGGIAKGLGWLSMSGFHCFLCVSMHEAWVQDAPVSALDAAYMIAHAVLIVVQQLFYLATWTDVGAKRAVETYAYVKELTSWRPPMTDAAALKEAGRSKSDPLRPDRYWNLRRWVSRYMDLPFVTIPQKPDWSVPAPPMKLKRSNPMPMPVQVFSAAVCTATFVLSFVRFTWDNLTTNFVPDFVHRVIVAAAISAAAIMVSVTVFIIRARSSCTTVVRGGCKRELRYVAPWRAPLYIASQVYANFVVYLVFTMGAAYITLFPPALWDRIWRWLVGLYSVHFAVSIFQRTVFARWLTDRTSVRRSTWANVASHVLTAVSIVSSVTSIFFQILPKLAYWILNFSHPMDTIMDKVPFLDGLHRSFWSLIALNNDCCHPVKVVAAAAFAAEAEMEFWRASGRVPAHGHVTDATTTTSSGGTAAALSGDKSGHLPADKAAVACCVSVESCADAPQQPHLQSSLPPPLHVTSAEFGGEGPQRVTLAEVGAHLQLPLHRHLVRLIVLLRCQPHLRDDWPMLERMLRVPRGTTVDFSACEFFQAGAPPSRLSWRRAAFRLQLLWTLHRLPQLQALRKQRLWVETYAVSPHPDYGSTCVCIPHAI